MRGQVRVESFAISTAQKDSVHKNKAADVQQIRWVGQTEGHILHSDSRTSSSLAKILAPEEPDGASPSQHHQHRSDWKDHPPSLLSGKKQRTHTGEQAAKPDSLARDDRDGAKGCSLPVGAARVHLP